MVQATDLRDSDHFPFGRLLDLARYGSAAPQYDAAGNVTLVYYTDRGTSYTYEYDRVSRLTAVYDDTGSARQVDLVRALHSRRGAKARLSQQHAHPDNMPRAKTADDPGR